MMLNNHLSKMQCLSVKYFIINYTLDRPPTCTTYYLTKKNVRRKWETSETMYKAIEFSGASVSHRPTGRIIAATRPEKIRTETREIQYYIRVAAIRSLRFVSSKIIRRIHVLFNEEVWCTTLYCPVPARIDRIN